MDDQDWAAHALVGACREGNWQVVKDLCERDENLLSKWYDVLELEVDIGSRSNFYMYDFCNASALHVSATNGQVKCCEVLLDLGADVDILDPRQRTPLMYAKISDVLRLLLSRGANVHARDEDGRTALHYCTLYGWSSEAVRELVSAGGDKNAGDSQGRTPLMATRKARGYVANLDEKVEAALELINLRADVNVKDVNGETALHRHSSVYHGKSTNTIVSALVAAGADLEAVDEKHHTPLFKASSAAFIEPPLSSLIFESGRGSTPSSSESGRGSTPSSSESGHGSTPRQQIDFSIVRKFVELGVNVHAVNNRGRTALMVAAQRGDAFVVHELSQVGARLDAEDEDGNTAIMLAAIGGHFDVVGVLVKAGAELDVCDKGGNTAIMHAAVKGDTNVVSQLIEASVDLEVRNKDGKTAIMLAATERHAHTVYKLVQAGANFEACDKCGRTAIMLAAITGQAQTVNALLWVDANLEVRAKDGSTAIVLAASKGHGLVVHELIKTGADFEVCDQDGNTAIMHAAAGGHTQAVERLIQAKANLEAHNSTGSTALMLATTNRAFDTACALVQAGAKVDKTSEETLRRAAENRHDRLACELVKLDIPVAVNKFTSYRLLGYAVKKGDTMALAKLVESGAPVNERDSEGVSILHTAVEWKQHDTVKWLIENGARVNAVASDVYHNGTPLHTAASAYHSVTERTRQSEMVKLLLAAGADPQTPNSQQQTPSDLATQYGCHLVASILKKAELVQKLIKAGGEAKQTDTVAIRFGGPPGAGKSTLAGALRTTRLQGFLRFENQTDEGATNAQQRTKGINCNTFIDDQSACKFRILDLGGHGEFLATHQTFIGDGTVPVIDCVVVSALESSLEESAIKWCSLFTSRNQPTPSPWPFLLIVTRADKANDHQQHSAMSAYHNIKRTFGEYFRFPFDKPFFIDARKSWKPLTVDLRRALSELHGRLLSHDKALRQPAICQRIAACLPAMQEEMAAPVVRKDKFIEFVQPEALDQLDINDSSNAVVSLYDNALQFLSGYATVLSFRQPLARSYVVINPHWLLSDIVGRLMAEPPLPEPYVHYDNGYAKKDDVIRALETSHLPGPAALEMVADLGFCLEQRGTDDILNPSKLLGYRREDHWRRDPAMTVNGGRRLKCKGVVAIANAFFPHLQVHFYHRYLADYKEKLPMWSGGMRLVAGKRSPAEALIESNAANMSIDIIVRGEEGSDSDCAKLLHELTEETLQKAVEISPGSQLLLFYLSRMELDELSPAGLPSRPCIEYAEDRVVDALQNRQWVTDGKASGKPEDPRQLLLWSWYAKPLRPLRREVSEPRWMIVLLELAKAINDDAECCRVAEALALNDREEDFVRKLRNEDPHRSSSSIVMKLFERWLRRDACQLTTEQRRGTLHRVFLEDLYRPGLAEFLDDELMVTSECEEDTPVAERNQETDIVAES